MELRIDCPQCYQDQNHPCSDSQSVDIRDDGIYPSKCSKGHQTITVIQQQKFEILFSFAAMAFADGYRREAVTNFAAALERFYEFYVFTTCLKHEIKYTDINKTWKHVSDQSERQLGAYLFAYLFDHKGNQPPLIDNEKPDLDDVSKTKTKSWRSFRNAVVHKGYIPTAKQTLAYGNIVYLHINELIADLQERSSDAVVLATGHHIYRAYEASNGMLVTTRSISTPVSLVRSNAPPESFEKALENIAEYRQWLNAKPPTSQSTSP